MDGVTPVVAWTIAIEGNLTLWLVCAFFVAALLLGSDALVCIGRTARRRRLRGRAPLDADSWFAQYAPALTDRAQALRFLDAIAHDVGVEWSRLRPADTLDKTYGCFCCGIRCDSDDLFHFDCEFQEWAQRAHWCSATGGWIPANLGELLEYVSGFNGRCKKCGYDLRGNTTQTCSECGHTSTERMPRDTKDENASGGGT